MSASIIYYLVRKNDKYGVWHNVLCIPCEYNEIKLLENNDLLTCKDGKYTRIAQLI